MAKHPWVRLGSPGSGWRGVVAPLGQVKYPCVRFGEGGGFGRVPLGQQLWGVFNY